MKQTGIEFIKPFGEKLFGTCNTVKYIYPREELIKDEIFPYFVMDGGAFNLANDIFGTVRGDKMLADILSDELFEVFRYKSKYNWERSFAYTEGTNFTRKYEWQIWPQRLYMILPIAHAFLRTGDKKYSDLWFETVKGWVDAHPYQEFDASITYFQTDMVWRDMQVAWRTLSLLHSVFMLQDAPFTEEQWKFLYDLIKQHTIHLYLEAKDRLERQKVQNHVLQIGTALILSASLFPEFEIASEALEMGKKIVALNMRGIFPEGGSEEDSPSYSHFIARLYLEAYLLLKNNGFAPLEGLEESVRNQYRWLYLCAAPTGKALRISDSYSIDAEDDIARVRRLIDLDLPEERKSILFPVNRFAMLKKGNISLYADAMLCKKTWGHLHNGRPQTLFFRKDVPVLVDAGCCSYDRWELYAAIQGIKYHNVVYCPDIPEREMEMDTNITDFGENFVTFTSDVVCGDVKYLWERKITIGEDSVEWEDTVTSETELNWRAHMLLQRQDTNFTDANSLMQITENSMMTLETALPYTHDLITVMNDDNKIDYAIVIENNLKSKQYKNKIKFKFTDRTI